MEQKQSPPRLQIYATVNTGISPFWREKFERDARKYWDIFYKRHQDKFFKDRHYLDKEWGSYFSGVGKKVILEVGCGAGNTIFPLIATYADIFVFACDFSTRAIDLVKMHKDFMATRVGAFVCDMTSDDLGKHISPSSVDIVTMVFMLSAVSPEKMALVLQNIKKVLKPNGSVLFRDYAAGDLAQDRFACKDQKITENFYVRGDGTRAFYFSNEFLRNLFEENGFIDEEISVCCKTVENRSREIVMNRRWIQAVFRFADTVKSTTTKNESVNNNDGQLGLENSVSEAKGDASKVLADDLEIDISEGLAVMFSAEHSSEEEAIEVPLSGSNFKISVLSKENQHTCKSTGLMLWEAARLMASILAQNPAIVSGKRVLELGSGCGGICSMVAARTAELVVATDGDPHTLELLARNIASNLDVHLLPKLVSQRLEWGNWDQVESVKALGRGGFDLILGTDVAYVAEAILPLFETAQALVSPVRDRCGSVLVLCHVLRRVDEESILSAASQHGFGLLDLWPAGAQTRSFQGTIGSWFSGFNGDEPLLNAALRIMCFQVN